jgi:hypothetical protein
VCAIEGSNETMILVAHLFEKLSYDTLGCVDFPRTLCRRLYVYLQEPVPLYATAPAQEWSETKRKTMQTLLHVSWRLAQWLEEMVS